MATKNSVQVLIGGKVYTLGGYESDEYLQKVAGYLDQKIAEVDQNENSRTLAYDRKRILVELNIADDYFKARERIEKLEQDLEIKEKELYDLKYELISEQSKIEAYEKNIRELEAKNNELLQTNARLEADIEDLLTDTVASEEEQAADSGSNTEKKK